MPRSRSALTMRLWTYDMNYAAHSPPGLVDRARLCVARPSAECTAVRSCRRCERPGTCGRSSSSSAVIAITAVALLVTGGRWSPEQRMPSAFGVEQVARAGWRRRGAGIDRDRPGGFGADSACGLHRLGRHRSPGRCPYAPYGRGPLRRIGRRCWRWWTPRAGRRCAGAPFAPPNKGSAGSKLTMRDEASGVLVQAVIPARVVRPMRGARPHRARPWLARE